MRLSFCYLVALFAVAKARVTFRHSEILQSNDLVNNEASFNCDGGCKVYTDRSDDFLRITQNGHVVASFTQIVGEKAFEPSGIELPTGNNYKIQSIRQDSVDFVFYAVSIDSPQYGTRVFVPQLHLGLTISSQDRYATFLSSHVEAMRYSGFSGAFPEGYPRIYTTGYDAVDESNPLYKARSQRSAQQSELAMYSSIVTVDLGFHGEHRVVVQVMPDYYVPIAASSESSTVFSSPGYVGCPFVGSQMYFTEVQTIHNVLHEVSKSLDVTARYTNVSSTEPINLRVNDDFFDLFSIESASFSKSYGKNEFDVEISWNRSTPGSSWSVQLDFGTVSDPTSGTTSSEYCNCETNLGLPIGWNYNDIWVDIVVVLDTSEAMGQAALEDAEALIESLISDGVNDFLVTDTNALFYSRIGVISMDDKATALFDLNMTKFDSMEGKATIKKGVSGMDFVGASEAALNMFKKQPARASTRQIIYFITDSDLENNLDSLNQFKASQGVIIVNNFLKGGEVMSSSLKNLASPGYFFSNGDYVSAGLQPFCKANCFCAQGKSAYGGADPAIIASGGCYHAATAGVPFNKAKTTCANAAGFLATIHDAQKGLFLQKPKSDYVWFGYEKTDKGWEWEDQSTETYTNWAVDEPSSASVAKCAYVDKSKSNLPWGAGNCQLGFPYACQTAPCSAGNKECQ